MLTTDTLKRVRLLKSIADRRNQTLARMALSWILAKKVITSVIIGPRTVEQLADSLLAMKETEFSAEELIEINRILL